MLDKTWKYSISYENFLKPDKRRMLTKRAPYNINRKGGEDQKLKRELLRRACNTCNLTN